MKSIKCRFMSLIIVLSYMFTVPASAAVRASDQIDAYDGDAIACGGGRIAIEFSIEGTDQM